MTACSFVREPDVSQEEETKENYVAHNYHFSITLGIRRGMGQKQKNIVRHRLGLQLSQQNYQPCLLIRVPQQYQKLLPVLTEEADSPPRHPPSDQVWRPADRISPFKSDSEFHLWIDTYHSPEST